MSKQKLLCLALLPMLLAGYANAENEERDAVLALMTQAFDAISSGNPDDMRAIQLAEGTSLSFRTRSDGGLGELEMRIATNEALVAGMIDDGHEYAERWTSDPTVMIRGPIAVVWGEYELLIDREFSRSKPEFPPKVTPASKSARLLASRRPGSGSNFCHLARSLKTNMDVIT